VFDGSRVEKTWQRPSLFTVARTMKNRKSFYQRLTHKVFWYDSYYVHSRWCKDVLEEIPLRVDDKVIEIGCGSGWLSRKMSKIVRKGEVVGLDVSEESIRKTRHVTEKDTSSDYTNLVFVVANAEHIPYPSGYFDCATSLYSLSFWDNPVEGLSEIKRVLKPNGKIYIIDAYDQMPVSYILGVELFNLFSPHKENLYSANEYREFFEKSGFVDVHQKRVVGTLLTAGTKT
jgi:ubiquinone/menaquinone biosynthesis C-methylase UbiE